MKLILFIFLYPLTAQISYSALNLPPDIISGITKSSTGESGGLFVKGVESNYFINYVCENWDHILSNINDLPKSEGNFTSEQSAINLPVIIVATACESLPPSEYLDFLDKFTELREKNLIDHDPYTYQLAPMDRKQDFLPVNWEHPRVQAILARARPLIPPDDELMLSWVDEVARGELADNYMTNKSDSAPLPETLPGIKLQRPWASLIRKYESLTGKKAPYDPKFDPRPSRHGDPSASPVASIIQTQSPWSWLVAALGILLFVATLWRLFARRKNRVASGGS